MYFSREYRRFSDRSKDQNRLKKSKSRSRPMIEVCKIIPVTKKEKYC